MDSAPPPAADACSTQHPRLEVDPCSQAPAASKLQPGESATTTAEPLLGEREASNSDRATSSRDAPLGEDKPRVAGSDAPVGEDKPNSARADAPSDAPSSKDGQKDPAFATWDRGASRSDPSFQEDSPKGKACASSHEFAAPGTLPFSEEDPEGLDLAERLTRELDAELAQQFPAELIPKDHTGEHSLMFSGSYAHPDGHPVGGQDAHEGALASGDSPSAAADIAADDAGPCWRPKAAWSRRRAQAGRSAKYQDILAETMVRSEDAHKVSPGQTQGPTMPAAMTVIEQGVPRSVSRATPASCLRAGEIFASSSASPGPGAAPEPPTTKARLHARSPLQMVPVPDSIQVTTKTPTPPSVPAAALRPYQAPVLPLATAVPPSLWERVTQWVSAHVFGGSS